MTQSLGVYSPQMRPLTRRDRTSADYHWFTQTCSRIGISSRDTAAQWNILAKITAITGAPPCAVTDEHFDTARVAMPLAYPRRGQERGRGLPPLAADPVSRRAAQ